MKKRKAPSEISLHNIDQLDNYTYNKRIIPPLSADVANQKRGGWSPERFI